MRFNQNAIFCRRPIHLLLTNTTTTSTALSCTHNRLFITLIIIIILSFDSCNRDSSQQSHNRQTITNLQVDSIVLVISSMPYVISSLPSYPIVVCLHKTNTKQKVKLLRANKQTKATYHAQTQLQIQNTHQSSFNTYHTINQFSPNALNASNKRSQLFGSIYKTKQNTANQHTQQININNITFQFT